MDNTKLPRKSYMALIATDAKIQGSEKSQSASILTSFESGNALLDQGHFFREIADHSLGHHEQTCCIAPLLGSYIFKLRQSLVGFTPERSRVRLNLFRISKIAFSSPRS